MRRADRTSYDFHTGAWLRDDPTTPREVSDASPVVPTSEPAPGRWTKSLPKRRSDEHLVALAVWATVAVVIGSIVVRSFALLGIAAVPLTLFCAFLAAKNSKSLSIDDADRQLLEDPDDRDVCLVHLTIVRNGTQVGTDKGAVWFSHGALLYSGHRTSFVIGGEDVLPRDEWSKFARYDGAEGLSETSIPLRIAREKTYVQLEPLVGKGGGSPQEMRFLKVLYDFRRRPPQSRIPRQWPPLEP